MGDAGSPAQAAGAGGTVHIIDDDEAVRRALEVLLRCRGIPAETHASGLAFLEMLGTRREDGIGCVVTDMRMPGVDGLELLQRLKALGFRRPVIVMTAHGDVSTAVVAMKAGAADFIEKPFPARDLLTMIETMLKSSQPPAGEESAAARIASLSPREREVLDLLVVGKPNKQIARELGLSPRTVEAHRARLMERLGVGSLAEAVRLAVQAELGQRARAEAPHEP